MTALILALALAAQWTDSGPEQQTPDGVTIAAGGESGHLKLSGWGWQGGYVERTSPGYLAFVANNPSYSTAASLYLLEASAYRPNGFALIAQHDGYPYARLRWDGMMFAHKGITTGPGTGSGNIALDCAPSEGMCYLAVQAHLPGGVQDPPRIHGALTVSNELEMGAGSYMLQLRHGATKNALLIGGTDPGNIWSSGNLLRLEGVNGMISTREGMRLDPGVGTLTIFGASGIAMDDPTAPIRGHVIDPLPLAEPADSRIPDVGDAEAWLDEGGADDVLRFRVRTSSGIKEASMVLE